MGKSHSSQDRYNLKKFGRDRDVSFSYPLASCFPYSSSSQPPLPSNLQKVSRAVDYYKVPAKGDKKQKSKDVTANHKFLLWNAVGKNGKDGPGVWDFQGNSATDVLVEMDVEDIFHEDYTYYFHSD